MAVKTIETSTLIILIYDNGEITLKAKDIEAGIHIAKYNLKEFSKAVEFSKSLDNL